MMIIVKKLVIYSPLSESTIHRYWLDEVCSYAPNYTAENAKGYRDFVNAALPSKQELASLKTQSSTDKAESHSLTAPSGGGKVNETWRVGKESDQSNQSQM